MRPTILDYEHLFWLAARDLVFFSSYNNELKDWDGGWCAVINCSDTFGYACADATYIAPGQEREVKEIYEKYGWSGLVAWCALERDDVPLIELQTEKYHLAIKELQDKKNNS